MRNLGRLRLAAAALVMAGSVSAGAALSALGDVQPGKWELRERGDAAAAPHTICVAKPIELVKVRQPSPGCQHRLLENTDRSATFTYSCPGIGQGRTAVTVETGRLVQIDTQGVTRGAPFAIAYEARRVGDCAAYNPPRNRRVG